MLLSQILEKENFIVDEQYIIKNEKEFDSLGLLVSDIDLKLCAFLDDERFLDSITDRITMLITTPELEKKVSKKDVGICVVTSPRFLFFKIHNYLSGNKEYIRKRFETKIGDNCDISEHAIIADHNVVIGNNVKIEEFVVIRENTVIGDNTVIRAGVKIGGVGFEFKRMQQGIEPVQHLGGVKIGKNVEIQYNTCIDKAVYPWDNTVVGNYSKIDNLVHVGHAVKISNNVLIVAQSGIGGRTVIESDCWVGFSTTISNGLHMGKSARANIGSVVTKNVMQEESVTGNFAISHEKFIKNLKNMV